MDGILLRRMETKQRHQIIRMFFFNLKEYKMRERILLTSKSKYGKILRYTDTVVIFSILHADSEVRGVSKMDIEAQCQWMKDRQARGVPVARDIVDCYIKYRLMKPALLLPSIYGIVLNICELREARWIRSQLSPRL